jgi:hypothetical protein
MKRFLVTMVFALLLPMPRAARAQLFQIISPPPPKVFGISAVKLSVPPTVWWTRLCVDVPEGTSQPAPDANFPVTGYSTLLWDTTNLYGDHTLTAFGYSQGGVVPVTIVDIIDPAPVTVSGTVTVTLGSIAPTVWWTRLCIDDNAHCVASGYSTLRWNSSLYANGVHDLLLYAYARKGITPIGSDYVKVNLHN